ncbi:1-deoxy-D-xylulose-5-phosphate reductoisomerase [Helicobacter bizzozeronii]|uniref:1-deoxy-D-xylulose-5-phosphate reductoisomerase n=1 Tax=Helicobacter bizzozeronii TaxID=56877 RepID=UPI0018F85C63|nr:1-deoxy-D-xylulose-5-phosphate reductoisomerase [Helicobacter bizzozeronii]
MSSILILGSTGSIGMQALKVAQHFNIKIKGLSAGRNIPLLNAQIKTHQPSQVAILDPSDRSLLQVPQGVEVFVGTQGICEMIACSQASLVLNAIVGFGGLAPTLSALQHHKKLALANKESLVVAGWLLDTKQILPIDSEHFGLWALLQKHPLEHVQMLYLTASGGALRDVPLSDIPTQSLEKVLQHPNWQMGAPITINSANMVNKLFEVLEAYWLFGLTNIDAYIERTSSVHALIRFKDHSVHAQLSSPNMQLPIAHALMPSLACQTPLIEPLDLLSLPPLRFEPIDTARYPLWALKNTLLAHPKLGVVLNASNEAALQAFRAKKIAFGQMANLIFQALEHFERDTLELHTLEDILALDQEVRGFCTKLF